MSRSLVARRPSSAWRWGALLVGLCAGCVHPQGAVISGADRAEIAAASAYLNGLTRFETRFEQSGAFGGGSGLVWLDRPGHLRVDYAGAGSRVMVISGGRVTVLDRGTGAITTQPLARTPLGILLAPDISLSGPVTVTGVQHFPGAVQITVVKTGQATQGSLTLTLGEAPWRLEAVTVTDPYARQLTLTLGDLDTQAGIAPGLFQPPGV
jgi:outer membrane lipoprotein-sorting protein